MGKRVLLVDDEPTIRYVGAEILADCGYEVSTAVNGTDAMEKLHTDPAYDVVITDLCMPVLDGYELIKQIRACPAHQALPIIVVTGYDECSPQPSEAGYQLKLHKPFELNALIEAIDILFG